MKDWFLGLQARDQRILLVGALVLGLVLAWAAIWLPMVRHRAALERGVAAERKTLHWMQQAATEVRVLRQRRHAAPARGGRSLLAIIDQSARAAGLGPGIRRIEPEGPQRIRVRLENVAFDKLMLWLDDLQRQSGALPEAVRIEQGEGAGLVDARLTLTAAGS